MGDNPEQQTDYTLCLVSFLGLLLGNHARAGATPSKWSTETAPVVAVGHCDVVAQAFTLDKFHQGKGVHAEKGYLILQWFCSSHFWRRFKIDNAGQSCTGSGLGNVQDDLLVRYHLM